MTGNTIQGRPVVAGPTMQSLHALQSRLWVAAAFLVVLGSAFAGCREEKEEPWPPYLMDIEFEITFRDSFTKKPIPNMVVGYGALKTIADPFSTPEQILATDITGKILGRDTMSIFQGLGFETPLMRPINGFDDGTNEGWAKRIEKLKSGDFSHVPNQFRYLAFSDNALIDSNRNDNYVRFKKDVFIDPNGIIKIYADWLPYNEFLKINVVEFDTLLNGPGGVAPGQVIPAPYPIYLPANKTFTLRIFLQTNLFTPLIHIVDTTWHVRKDSLYEYAQILDTTQLYKSLYQLTIKKPKHLKS